MREFDVKVKMMDGSEWYLPFSLFHTAGITDRPEAVIGNAVRGSNSPVFLAFKEQKSKGESEYIVAINIISFTIVYR